MSEKKLGIDNLKKVVNFIVEGANVAEKLKENGNWLTRVMALMPMADEVLALFSLDPKLLPAELNDFSPEEREEMLGLIKEKYNIADEELEDMLEDGLEVINDLALAIERASVYSKRWKKS